MIISIMNNRKVSKKRKSLSKTKPKRRTTSKKHKKPRQKRQNSNTKQTWEKFLRNKDSVKALKESWKAKDPEKHYRNTLSKLARKFSSGKKR